MGGIVWLASYPKSGNTWLRAFLHNLLRNPETPIEPDRLTEFTIGTADARWYQQYTDRPLSELSAQEFATLRPRVQHDYTQAFPDSVFVKTHNYLGEDHGAPLICMEYTAGAIYVLRNPLDVCISAADHYGFTLDEAITMLETPGTVIGGNDDNAIEVLGSWSTHVWSWTQSPNPGLHVMRYEDMHDKPMETFATLTRFLGFDAPRERLKRAIKFSDFRTMRKLEQEHGFRERSDKAKRFFRSGKTGQWRGKLSPEQIARVVETHREQMARFGYVPDGY
jgi:hypothetical protein